MVSIRICVTLMMITCMSSDLVSGQSLSSLWNGKEADVYFLLDSSSSVWIVDYKRMLDFVVSLVSEMDIGPTKTRVGVGVYSVNFHEYIAIDNNRDKDELLNAIKDTPYLIGNTYISRAIYGLRTVGLSPGKTRDGVPHIAVLITDGTSRHKDMTLSYATMAKREGISLFTIGVGWDVDKFELRNVASDPKSDFVFFVYSFHDLKNVKENLSRKMAAVEYLQKDQRGTCGGDVEADIVFIYDEAVFGRQESIKINKFISSVAAELSMNSGKVRVGVVSKTCHEGKDINLNSYLTTSDFQNGLENSDRGPGLADLLKRAWFDGFHMSNGERSGAKKRLVLIINEPLPQAVPSLAFMAKTSAEIFVIRIGEGYNKTLLGLVASGEGYITYYETTEFLEKGKSRFTDAFCTGL